MNDCDIGSVPATARRVTKPKIYEGVLSCRMWPGMLDRIETLKGDELQGHFVRRLLLNAIKQLEAERGLPSPPDPDPSKDIRDAKPERER